MFLTIDSSKQDPTWIYFDNFLKEHLFHNKHVYTTLTLHEHRKKKPRTSYVYYVNNIYIQ